MDADENIVAETPDLEFDSEPAATSQNIIYTENEAEEEQVERILDEIAGETPDLDFSEPTVDSTDEPPTYNEEDEDIDDLDEPDQYVDEDDENAANNNESDTNETNGKCTLQINKIHQISSIVYGHCDSMLFLFV